MIQKSTAAGLRPKGEIKQLRPMLPYLRPYRMQIILAGIALLFTSSSVLAMGGGLRYLVDEGLGKRNVELLNWSFFLLLFVTVALAMASFTRFYLVSWIGERVVADIRNDVYRHLTAMHIGYFETTRTGEILSRLTTDTTLLQLVIGGAFSMVVRNILLFVGGLVLLLLTSARLTGYVLMLGPFVIIPIIVLGRKVRIMARETQAKIADISAHAEESLNAIRTIQSLALEPEDQQRFSHHVNIAMQASINRIRARAYLNALVIMLVFGAVIAVIWVGGKDVLAGHITNGELAAFVFYSVIVASAIGAISELITDLQRAAGAAERISELLGIPSEVTSPSEALALPDVAQAKVIFDHVTFTYPTRPDKSAVQDFTLTVEPGRTIALVGPSGAGKSTIFQLLLRFYDPAEGIIRINDTDIRKAQLPELRRMIGIVPQDPVIFSTTARENIRIGRVGAMDDDIMQAAKAACALEFIEKLPQGFDTFLGEKGVRLSGGQRQRLAIARALVRDPKLLLLDEATSALDSENEHYIQQALEQLLKGRTTFVIAHRLSTIMQAHQIVLMNEGRIEAVGTHKELLAKSPLYARLAELQFRTAA